ncbi:MAG: SDR family oxidoreductase [Firmicutes bacterium]|nr:SDR family oxidoreductase [Bacillota bacterium]MBR3301613.1 SDR family oxidoreductase [Bacillota bacterium]MBR6236880.1 SDR family oxidoreductase [Bacillota bacterium]
MQRLKDKVAIVTGAAMGIGKGIAEAFVREGAKVVVADMNDEVGKQTVEELKAAGGDAVFVHVDISDEDQVKNVYDVTVKTYGGLDILVNNAGVYNVETEKIHELETSKWKRLVDINLNGTFMMCKHAIPIIIKAKDPCIINMSSPAGQDLSMRAAYGATKGAIIQLTKSIAMQYPGKIRANAICPGSTDTPGRNVSRKTSVHAKGSVAQLLQRDGKPRDVAAAAVFIASEGNFMNAAVLRIDGGLTSQRPKPEDLAPWKEDDEVEKFF